mmetsp:Transcript_9317/g.16895  ORF Transcript_9317/g.16895 Transcript_9317/m.16895 type:complete len:219 (+) Transcript_9317:1472-2128(+)
MNRHKIASTHFIGILRSRAFNRFKHSVNHVLWPTQTSKVAISCCLAAFKRVQNPASIHGLAKEKLRCIIKSLVKVIIVNHIRVKVLLRRFKGLLPLATILNAIHLDWNIARGILGRMMNSFCDNTTCRFFPISLLFITIHRVMIIIGSFVNLIPKSCTSILGHAALSKVSALQDMQRTLEILLSTCLGSLEETQLSLPSKSKCLVHGSSNEYCPPLKL